MKVNLARDTLVTMFIIAAAVAVGKMFHPMLGLGLLFIFGGLYFAGRTRRECSRCGPVFSKKLEPKVEIDKDKGTVRILTVYQCRICWQPIHAKSQMMPLEQYEQLELNKMTSAS